MITNRSHCRAGRARTGPLSQAITTACTRSRSPELAQDPAHVRFHGHLGDGQLRGGLRVGQAGRQETAERQIDLLCTSQAMAAAVLAVVPNGGYLKSIWDKPWW